ncbi:MAG TPA: hypothetical protein VGM30_03305 [Puia sp.]
MKNALSILLLFSWTLFHYSRIERLLQCPFAPPLSTTGIIEPCDCWKYKPAPSPLADINSPDGSSGASKSFSRPAPDDPFTEDNSLTPKGYFQRPVLTVSLFLLPEPPAGYTPAVFQPPRG